MMINTHPVHIRDYQPVTVITDDDLRHKRLKYVTIKTNSKEAKRHFCSSFKDKSIIDLMDISTPHYQDCYELFMTLIQIKIIKF